MKSWKMWSTRLAAAVGLAILLEIVLRVAIAPLTPRIFRDHAQAGTLTLLPGARAMAHIFSREISVTVDSSGNRTTVGAIANGRPRRILDVVGDSQVFGWGLSDFETVPSRLQAALGAQWETINHGVPGFGPWQYQEILNAIPRDHQVVVLLTEENDLFDTLNVGLASSYCGYMSTGFADRFELPCVFLDSRLFQGWQAARFENAAYPTPIGFTTSSQVVASVAAYRVKRWIDAERSERRDHLLVSVIPWRGRLHADLRRDYFPTPDATQQVLLPDDAGMRERFAQYPAPVSLYLPGDSHLSPAGAQLLSDGLLPFLRRAADTGSMIADNAGGGPK